MHSRRVVVGAVLLLGTAASATGLTFKTSTPVVRVSEHQNKKTVTLHKGQQLQVVLHSTYWQFQQVSNRAVLRPRASPSSVRSCPAASRDRDAEPSPCS